MGKKIEIEEIYEQNLNFLIGSGASVGIAPPLKVNATDLFGDNHSIESLATLFEKEKREDLLYLIFAHYYCTCIHPIANLGKEAFSDKEKLVLENYAEFLSNIIKILNRRNNFSRKCNIFTTNYDGAFEIVAERMISSGGYHFSLNDGSSGFINKHLHPKNFNNFSYQAGIFDGHLTDIPQINLIHLHGSIYWSKDGEKIKIDYLQNLSSGFDVSSLRERIADFRAMLDREDAVTDQEILKASFGDFDSSQFFKNYLDLPIVNPTKKKFQQTVFDEHYYQMLRLMSYEMEKPDSVFISFGFSFADEHIRNLVKRSLSNPRLKLFICCFDSSEKEIMESHFQGFNNVELIALDENLDFTRFNQEVFVVNHDGDK